MVNVLDKERCDRQGQSIINYSEEANEDKLRMIKIAKPVNNIKDQVYQRNTLQNSQVGVKEGLFLVGVSTNHFILAEALQNQREVITSNVTGTVKIGQ